jgi:hypothetical protein
VDCYQVWQAARPALSFPEVLNMAVHPQNVAHCGADQPSEDMPGSCQLMQWNFAVMAAACVSRLLFP